MEEKQNLNSVIVRHSYIDIRQLGPEIAKYISFNKGVLFEFQPDVVMYARHSIPYRDHVSDEDIAINYFLIVKSSEKKDSYSRDYNKDLSDLVRNGSGLVLYNSSKANGRPGDKLYFNYLDDANGEHVPRDFRRLPFYYIDDEGALKRVYENFGNMYDVIDLIIQKRIQLEMTEIKTSYDTALKKYFKKKNENK